MGGKRRGKNSKSMKGKRRGKNSKSMKDKRRGKNNKSMKDKQRGKNKKSMKGKQRGKNNKSMKGKRRGRNNRQKHRQRRRKNKVTYSPMRRLANLGQLNTKATFHNQQASRALGFAGFAAKKGAKNEDFKTSLKMAEWLRDDMKGDVQGLVGTIDGCSTNIAEKCKTDVT